MSLQARNHNVRLYVVSLDQRGLKYTIKGRDRQGMVVELKVQYCREKLKISFDTNRTFLRCTILLRGLQYFTSCFSQQKNVFYNYLVTRTKNVKEINL